LLPTHFSKAIYLDSDLIVQGNIEELWNIDLGDNYLLAVQDLGAPYVSSPRGLTNYRQLGIPPEYKYFNAGVLVLNLEKWRADEMSEKILEYVVNNKQHIRWHDQDALNAMLAGKWGELDPRWNQIPYLFKYSSWEASPFTENVFNDLTHNPFIVHFATRDKPWHESCNHPQKDLFFQYLDDPIWATWSAEQAQKKEKQEKVAYVNKIYGSFKQQLKSLFGLGQKPKS
jgi:lipopolysaccharide biosynthesis glycosyltransferase